MADKDIILSKWLQGHISDEEVKSELGDIDLVYLRKLLSAQEELAITTSDPEERWDKFKSQVHAPQKTTSSARWFWVFIGFTLLTSLMTIWYVQSKKEVVKTDPQEFQHFAFEDGSSTRLWPGSSITYEPSSYLSERKIKLKGQAFFDVIEGSSFVVETEAGEVQVLGTSFDVWDIDKSNMDVRCHSGSVAVRDNRGGRTVLVPGEKVVISNGTLGKKITFDPSLENQESGLKYYDSVDPSWVIDDIQKLYGLEFRIDSDMTKDRFTGVISTKDSNKALTYLCETMRWQCDQQGKVVNVSSQE